MMEAGLQELLLDSLFTYSLLILGSFLSVFPVQTVNFLHEFFGNCSGYILAGYFDGTNL